MMKKTIRKTILLGLCAATCLTAGMAFAACGNVVPFEKEEKVKGPQFLDGALSEVHVNDTIVLAEYIELTSDDYSVKITDANGNEDRISGGNWYPEEPGTYTLTYTIHSGKNKGKNTFTFHVAYPELSWQFTLQNEPYNVGEEMVFTEYFNKMNIFVDYAGPSYEIIMDRVSFGEGADKQTVDLAGQDSYVFNSLADHTFEFHVEASDGQTCDGREVITMKSVDAEYMATLTDMGVSMAGELYVEEGNVTLVKGSYNGGNNNGAVLTSEMKPHVLPYVAYNGDYGIGDLVKVDFTGKNMPILSFFRDEYSQSAFDGSKGWVATGGFTNNSGNPLHKDLNNDFTLYGPYMMGKYDEDRSDTRSWGAMDGTAEAPYPGSFNSLQDGTRYRMICGFTAVRKGRVGLLNYNYDQDYGKYDHLNMDKSGAVDTLILTFQCLILNLDTNEIFSEFSKDTYGIQACRFDKIPLSTENNPHFQGNIVMYGQYGRQTTLDDVYPVITGKSFDQVRKEEAPQATFKETAPSFVKFGEPINVSDFVDTTNEGYTLFYRDSRGEDTYVAGATFAVPAPGQYTLFYKYGKYYYGEWKVFVGDSKYNATEENGKIVLGAGGIGNGAGYAKGDIETGYVDQAYYAIDGDYGMNDYIAFDFTGKNLPEIAFFAKNYSNSMYADGFNKRGIVVVTGITTWDGQLGSGVNGNGKQINYGYPYMIQNATNGGFVENAFAESKLGRANLVDGTHYRLIMGFTEHAESAKITLKWYLYNLDTNEIVEESSMSTWGFFTGSNAQVGNMTREQLSGSIVLYGKFGTECTVDKLHGVFENTTIEDVISALENN